MTPAKPTRVELAKMLEHSVLEPTATLPDVTGGCILARGLGVGVMMVQPCWLGHAVVELAGSTVIPASVLSFPHGLSIPSAKAAEAERLALLGAREIDMVMNLSALKSQMYDFVRDDIAGVVASVGDSVRIKVILETALLTEDEIVLACGIAEEAGAAFVKTSTGFGSGGATCEAVALMRRSVSASMGVKASGGIRNLRQVLKMLESGASRIGTSATEKILLEMNEL